jgi:hypothetical protein
MSVLAEQIAIHHGDHQPRKQTGETGASCVTAWSGRETRQSREFSQLSAVLRPASGDLKCDVMVCEVAPQGA